MNRLSHIVNIYTQKHRFALSSVIYFATLFQLGGSYFVAQTLHFRFTALAFYSQNAQQQYIEISGTGN